MDHEKSENDKMDDVILPGFRFHPTDEELVGFYLKRKIQHRALPIELIKQVDIYKYDPWDLPKLASTGEKEWYFYCPRDRKYRNSARPNRVTGAGFWKATGTDRPIYSSDGINKCIGLKKSLVFYRGRAAKGLKTDWMMHEFRLPTINNDLSSPKKTLDKNLPLNIFNLFSKKNWKVKLNQSRLIEGAIHGAKQTHDSWAICRIFKKTSSMAQRALSQSWISHLPEATALDIYTHGSYSPHFNSDTMQLFSNSNIQNVSTLNIPSYKPVINPVIDLPFMFSPLENLPTVKNIVTANSVEFNEPGQQFNSFCIDLLEDFKGMEEVNEDLKRNLSDAHDSDQWRSEQPFNISSDIPWDSPSYNTSDMSTTYSTN